MPQMYRTRDGHVGRPRQPLLLTLADGTQVESIWSGVAQEENLLKWLSQPGHQLSQSEEIEAIAIKNEDAKEPRWGSAPAGARLLFILRPKELGGQSENRHPLARLVTTSATPAEEAYYQTERSALFGFLNSDGSLTRVAPLPVPATPQLACTVP